MTKMTNEEVIEQLLVEVTALRLITRAIIGQMVAHTRQTIPEVVRDFEESMAKTSPEVIPLPDVDSELQTRASLLAQRRATALLEDLSTLVAPLREKEGSRAA